MCRQHRRGLQTLPSRWCHYFYPTVNGGARYHSKWMIKIATWNINSAKARLETIVAWLKEASPDVACFQELKCENQAFPRQTFEDLGYNVAVHGQKTYNGVAILSKHPFDEVKTRLPGDDGGYVLGADLVEVEVYLVGFPERWRRRNL